MLEQVAGTVMGCKGVPTDWSQARDEEERAKRSSRSRANGAFMVSRPGG